MKIHKLIIGCVCLLSLWSISGCNIGKGGGGGFNLYPVSEDIKLGLQVSKEIESNSKDFPILPEAGNQEIYRYVRGIRDKILNSGGVKHRSTFKWELKIIDDKETLNAFVTPGGYIYVYLGLIKFLDSEDQLAGVLGHEIAHADRRHATRQMTSGGMIGLLSQAVLGNSSAAGQVTNALIGLKFSRSHESEADEYSVKYLCNTEYNAAGSAGFFKKIQSQGGKTPQFLSTHPNPENRVENIELEKRKNGCKGNQKYLTEYARMKNKIR